MASLKMFRTSVIPTCILAVLSIREDANDSGAANINFSEKDYIRLYNKRPLESCREFRQNLGIPDPSCMLLSETIMSDPNAEIWTDEEDALMCIMMHRGMSWADMEKAIGRSQTEIKAHYVDFKALVQDQQGFNIHRAMGYIESLFSPELEKKIKDALGDNKADAQASTSSEPKPAPTGKPESGNKDEGKEKASEYKKDPKSAKNVEEPDYVEILHHQFPGKDLKPDDWFTERDCQALSAIEARYRANKWLHIEADFVNLTGRYINSEIIRAKFEKDVGLEE
ncbi:hypothetical protein M426DRAFT_119583 [Hypoxylon sp. CI-4A]|nr:hypothetical protein M426DRAFT_119583 [Hypoxylon sp. CI-4A]